MIALNAELLPKPTDPPEVTAKVIDYPDERLRVISRPVATDDDEAMC